MKGNIHEFLGMKLDYSKKGKVVIDMVDYVTKMCEDFPHELDGEAKTPAAEFLFKVNEKAKKLSPELRQDFHTFVAKGLFLCKRARPDIQTTIAFLTTRVQDTDEDNWKKLLYLLKHLKGTSDLVLPLEASKCNFLKWYVDAAYAVH